MNIADILLNSAIAREIDLMRFTGHLRNIVVAMLEAMATDVMAQLLEAATLSSAKKSHLASLLEQVASTIDSDYTGVKDVMVKQMRDLAFDDARWALRDVEASAPITLGTSLPTRGVLARLADTTLIHGAPSAEWWDRQSGDTRFRFTAAIRQGVMQGETNQQIVQRLRREGGAMGEIVTSKRNAEALVRSSVAAISSAARLDAYKANSDVIKGVQQVSTLDARTTDICIAYDGGSWDLDGNPINGTKLPFNGGPPRHWNCRSTLVPIVMSLKELGLDAAEFPASTRASMDGQVASTVSFADWLKAKSVEFQDEVLGRGRAELWRNGTISLTQLLDQRGNPLTLAQLRKRYGE